MSASIPSANPVVLLTGASRGLGLSVANLLLSNPSSSVNVISVSRSKSSQLSQLEEDYPDRFVAFQGDVSSESDNAKAVQLAIQKWSRLDALILNAGIANLSKIQDLTAESFAHQLSVNTVSLITTVRAALPYLKKAEPQGRVVFVSSGAAVGATAGWCAYNATKAAMNSICRTLANEEPELACFAVRPGVVDTDMQTQIRSQGTSVMSPSEFERFIKLHEEGKLLKPELPGSVIANLAIRGSRKDPVGSDGKGIGEVGGFVNWDAAELKGFRDSF
ncbi:NAD(P)-binding protein [Violaceomyces palustris]|uniref:NAD(P)-binding protein n=1 Tax=Violaceomyces palustris TaxID=1673888 RepID=A0ACD0NZV0_9BASI|nr:NAD(P)-binding protein [Violaceomyces palustris]